MHRQRRARLVHLLICTIACGVALRAGSQNRPTDTLSSVRVRMIQLEDKLHRAEALRDIKRLQYSYAHYAESGLWLDLGDLFAANGVAHYVQGDYRGPESLRKFYLQELGRGQLGLADGRIYPHIMIQPVITVAADGKTAQGRWHVIAMLGSYGTSASWAGVVYENRYVFEDGVWKINELSFNSQYSGRYSPPGLSLSKWDLPYHFTPRSAGAPAAAASASPGASLASAGLEELQHRWADLARRAQQLGDESDVLNLQHTYGYLFDQKRWSDVASLFASDGTLELGQRGVYAGRNNIRRALANIAGDRFAEGEAHDHLQLATVVHVAPDRRTAQARGVELSVTGTAEGGARWEEGIFENEYLNQDGSWKIRSIHYYPRVITDYELGWAKDARPAAQASSTFPPDRPPTEAYKIYPTMYYARFHYPNPVTHLAVQYPPGVRAAENSNSKQDTSTLTALPDPPKSANEFARRLAALDRQIDSSVAYDAIENLVSAHGYYLDDSRDGLQGLFVGSADRGTLSGADVANRSAVHQTVQPVIQIAPDGQSATIRARLFKLGGKDGALASGTYEGRAINRDGVWKLQSLVLRPAWSSAFTHSAPVVERKR